MFLSINRCVCSDDVIEMFDSFNRSLMIMFVRLFVRFFFHSFESIVCSFKFFFIRSIRLFVRSFVRSFIHSFVSFVRSPDLVRSFNSFVCSIRIPS